MAMRLRPRFRFPRNVLRMRPGRRKGARVSRFRRRPTRGQTNDVLISKGPSLLSLFFPKRSAFFPNFYPPLFFPSLGHFHLCHLYGSLSRYRFQTKQKVKKTKKAATSTSTSSHFSPTIPNIPRMSLCAVTLQYRTLRLS